MRFCMLYVPLSKHFFAWQNKISMYLYWALKFIDLYFFCNSYNLMFCCFGLFFACANILLINPRVLYSVWILHNIILGGMQQKYAVLHFIGSIIYWNCGFLVMYCNRTEIMLTITLSPKKSGPVSWSPSTLLYNQYLSCLFSSRRKEKYYCMC